MVEEKIKVQRRHRIFEVMERKADVELEVNAIKCCSFCPLVLIFVGLCVFFIIEAYITVQSPNNLTENNVPSFYDQSQLILASNLSSVIPCKALSITSWTGKKTFGADFFLFESKVNLKYDKRVTSHNKLLLRTDKYWSAASFVTRKGMYLSSNFCLISNSSSAIRLYIVGNYYLNEFNSSWPDTDTM